MRASVDCPLILLPYAVRQERDELGAIFQRPRTSQPGPEYKVYPYLLRTSGSPSRTRCGRRCHLRWRSLKYEYVHLNAFETGSNARVGIGRWIDYDNTRRPHSALAGQTPDEAYTMQLAPAGDRGTPRPRRRPNWPHDQSYDQHWQSRRTVSPSVSISLSRAIANYQKKRQF